MLAQRRALGIRFDISNFLRLNSIQPKVVHITTFCEAGMDETVSAAEANRRFSELLRGVREGHSYIVTSHGRPVARIVPANEALEAQREAREKLLARLKSQPALNIGSWTRDELYDE